MSAKKTTRRPQKTVKKSSKAVKSKRAVHKRFFLHPMTIMVILLAGVFIAGYTYKVVADSFQVTAVVDAPALTDGAYITYPANNETFPNSSLEVLGTCPPSSYIKLYDNNLFVGVAWCLPDNTFHVVTQLYYYNNILLAQDYNVTDQAGPITPSITIYYEKPNVSPGNKSASSAAQTGELSPSLPTTISSPPNAESSPIILTSDFQFKTETVSKNFTWNIDLSGGTPPYKVNVNWGDHTSTNYLFNTDPVFNINHTYITSGYFPIVVEASDAKSFTRIIQLAAFIKQSNTKSDFLPGVANTSTSSNDSTTNTSSPLLGGIFGHIKTWIWVTWSTYAIILLMMISFWLGEREEDYHIFRRRYRYAHKHR